MGMTSERVVPQPEIAGQTTIDDQVVGAIVNTAVQEVEGVSGLGAGSVRRIISERLGGGERRARGVGIVAGRREAIVDIELNVRYGCSIPDVVSRVRQSVFFRISDLCGLTAKEINVRVIGIEFSGAHLSRFGRVE